LNLVALQSSKLKHDSQPLHVFIGREPSRGVLDDELYGWFIIRLNFHRLALTHYSLRHYISQRNHTLRSWRLEGSNDGVQWILLRDHIEDEALNGPGSSATFSIAQSTGGKKFYSWFRIMITGTNSTKIYRNLCCSGVEMFGTLEMIDSENKNEEKIKEQQSALHSIPLLLESLELSQYADKFAVENVDFNCLRLLSPELLRELIPSSGHRAKLEIWRQTNGYDYHQPEAAIQSIQVALEKARLLDEKHEEEDNDEDAQDQENNRADRPELFAVFEISVQSIVRDGQWNSEKESLINQLKLSFHISEGKAQEVLDHLGWNYEAI
jgi:hypothetical protein